MREMLRIKRSVQAMYNTQINMMSAQMLNSSTSQMNDSMDAMKLLDNRASENGKYINPIFNECVSLLKISHNYINSFSKRCYSSNAND